MTTGSTTVYRDGVPFRRVALAGGEHVDPSDTSGPHTDPDATVDVHSGLNLSTVDAVGGDMTEMAERFHDHGDRVYLPVADA